MLRSWVNIPEDEDEAFTALLGLASVSPAAEGLPDSAGTTEPPSAFSLPLRDGIALAPALEGPASGWTARWCLGCSPPLIGVASGSGAGRSLEAARVADCSAAGTDFTGAAVRRPLESDGKTGFRFLTRPLHQLLHRLCYDWTGPVDE